MSHRHSYAGPALLSIGLRPFFLFAILFAAGVIPVWLMVWRGEWALGSPFNAIDWHIHEMIYGYASAVVAGFLFTAIPNWTGRMPARGWPLAALAMIWMLGRIAVAGGLSGNAVAVMAFDCSFLLAIAVMIAVEIIAGRNWRNLKIVIPVMALFASNAVFHLEAMHYGEAEIGRRLGLAIMIVLITLIGGRVIPSFTRNWLVKQDSNALPVPTGRYDGFCVAWGAFALLAWAVKPESRLTAALLLIAAATHLIRLVRWNGLATWRSPLLLMLHVAYMFVPLGLGAAGFAAIGLTEQAVPAHLLGIGAVGGMTLAMMARATRGHTGHRLVAGKAISLAFVLIVSAAFLRSFAPGPHLLGLDGIDLAGGFWTIAYLVLAAKLAPSLIRANAHIGK